jgi:hypothetical protein
MPGDLDHRAQMQGRLSSRSAEDLRQQLVVRGQRGAGTAAAAGPDELWLLRTGPPLQALSATGAARGADPPRAALLDEGPHHARRRAGNAADADARAVASGGTVGGGGRTTGRAGDMPPLEVCAVAVHTYAGRRTRATHRAGATAAREGEALRGQLPVGGEDRSLRSRGCGGSRGRALDHGWRDRGPARSLGNSGESDEGDESCKDACLHPGPPFVGGHSIVVSVLFQGELHLLMAAFLAQNHRLF